ncbi:hypothetical protein ABPG75_007327 [Micractinium tetrahymenae]
MEALVAAAVPAMPGEQPETVAPAPSGDAQNGAPPLNGFAEPVKPGGVHMSEAAASDPQNSGEGPQAILELPQGLPGLLGEQVGPKYKRGRGRSFFKEQPKKGAVCQVPGCDRSLHKLRDYYKRYKICPYHLELPCLVVEGQTIRFCQQCGRFQLLTDFEGDRRSCRRKLDKHNERRRKAEAEQKLRMMDSGSDSPGSTRGAKAHRVLPYRGGLSGGGAGGGYKSPPGGGDLGSRLKALSHDPTLQEGVGPGLLQSLADPGMAGMDWLAAGSLTNLAIGAGPNGALPPMPPPIPPPMPQPVLPPELMALLPADVQQQVMQQGAGVLSGSLLDQLQQLGQTAAAPPPPPPPPQRTFGGLSGLASLFGMAAPAAPAPPPPVGPYGAALPPGAAALLAPALHQQQVPAAAAPPAARATLDAASVFLQQIQQHAQQQQQQQQPPQQQPAVPLVRSEPTAAQPAQAADTKPPAGAGDKASLLVALARSVGVSSEELAKALAEGGVSNGLGLQIAAAAAAPTGAAAQPSPVIRPEPQLAQAPPMVPSAATPSQPASLTLHQVASDSMGRVGSGGSAHTAPMDASRPGSSAGGATSSPPMPQPLQQQPGSVFRPVASLGTAGSGALPAGAPPGNGAAAAARSALDLEQLQSAVQNNGLSAGFATDANLLLQLVAAVEAAQREAGASKERMHSLSLKLFNCTPDRLPSNILEQLEKWMVQNTSLLEGATRPGCVHLSVSALMSGAEFAALSESFTGMVQRLASGGLGGVRTSILAQLDGHAALLDESQEQLLQLDLAASAGVAPELCSVRPLAVTPCYSGPIMVTGRNIGDPQDMLFCRNGDAFPTTEVLGRGVLLRCPTAGDKHWALLRIPSLEEGCLRLEAQRGLFISAPHSLLVLDDEAAVAELRQLETADCAAPEVAELLHRLGAVLRFERALRQAGEAAVDAELLARVARAAQELAATCLLRGWGAVLRHMLPLACAGSAPEAAVAGIEAHLAGMPLLHAAGKPTLTGCPAVVWALGQWAAAAGLPLSLEASWGGGLTALHVATLLRQPEGTALALTELFPAAAPAVWAAACSQHGQETPLSLACRLNKRQLLRALAAHSVPAAGAMLAALELQDEVAAAAAARAEAAAPLPASVGDAAEELALQRQQWARLYGSKLSEEAAALPVAAGSSWPGTPAASGDARTSAVALAHGLLRQGHESPSSVLGLPPAAVGMRRKGSEASDELEELPAEGLAASGIAQFLIPVKKDHKGQLVFDGALPRHCSAGPSKGLAAALGADEAAEKAAALLWVFGDAATERSPCRWHASKLFTMDSLLPLLVSLLCCGLLGAAPTTLRQQIHLRLLSTVARAPLMLQPLLLLCQPARRMYLRRSRDSLLAALHLAMFALQLWALNAGATDWLSRNPVLLSHPIGLWLLVAVFTLQVRFALQVPPLLMMYLGNVVLLPPVCKDGASAGGTAALLTCVAESGMHMFVEFVVLPLVLVVLPVMSAWLVEARARTLFASMHANSGRLPAAA